MIRSVEDSRWDNTSKIKTGEQVDIPNTVLALWVGEYGDSGGKKAVKWDKDIAYLQARGFHVVEQDASWGEAAFLNWVGLESGAKTLHGLFVTGHGSRYGFGSGGKKVKKEKEPSVWVSYDEIKEKLNYDLGLVILNVCNGGFSQFDRGQQGRYGGKDIVSSSPGAIFFGLTTILVPIKDTAHPSELLKPGDQGTKP